MEISIVIIIVIIIIIISLYYFIVKNISNLKYKGSFRDVYLHELNKDELKVCREAKQLLFKFFNRRKDTLQYNKDNELYMKDSDKIFSDACEMIEKIGNPAILNDYYDVFTYAIASHNKYRIKGEAPRPYISVLNYYKRISEILERYGSQKTDEDEY